MTTAQCGNDSIDSRSSSIRNSVIAMTKRRLVDTDDYTVRIVL
jgi:hypothetical protein